jgi:hypothetical protein
MNKRLPGNESWIFGLVRIIQTNQQKVYFWPKFETNTLFYLPSNLIGISVLYFSEYKEASDT